MKKTVCLLLALILTAAVLTGCGGTGADDTTQKSNASGTASANAGGSEKENVDSGTGEAGGGGFKIGNTVTFGRYEQDNDTTDGTEAIEWRVIDLSDGKALLISVYGLDAKQYNSGLDSITWENCLLRKWLNEDFYNAAFSEEEQARIATTQVENKDSAKFGTSGGKDTEDKIFLLSFDEVNRYFDSKDAKKCVPTAYAVANGVEESTYAKVDGRLTSYWWLRSPGSNSIYVSGVRDNGNADEGGFGVTNTTVAVRPAMWVSIG